MPSAFMSSTKSADGRTRHAANDYILQHCGKATRAFPTGAAPGSQAHHQRQATEANISKFLGVSGGIIFFQTHCSYILSGKKSGEIKMHVCFIGIE